MTVQRTHNQNEEVLSKPTGFWATVYLLSVRIIYFVCGFSWFRKLGRRQKKHAAQLDLFLQATNFPQALWPEIRRNALVTDLVAELWGQKFMTVAPIILEGREHMERTRNPGKGLILARFHQKMGKSRPSSPLSSWIERQDFKPALTIRRGRKKHAADPETSEKLINAQELFEARNILRKGGVIQIVPDGLFGSTGIRIHFYARNREFRTGFAELAILANANVLPICAQFRMNGTLVIKLLPLLEVPNAESHEQAVTNLVAAYVTLLGEFWMTSTHMIVYHHMKKHLNFPE